MGIEDDLQGFIDKENAITQANARVANFSYEQEAYDNDDLAGVTEYDPDAANNIPLGSASYLKVNPSVLEKGIRADGTTVPRNLANHFFGRVSMNLNKCHDWLKSFYTAFKNALGAAGGIATLDANGRVPYSQMPESAMNYLGSWDASTNTPQINDDGTAGNTNGDFYIVSVAGSHDFGHGSISFKANDRVICTGSGASSVWQKLPAGELPASKGSATKPVYTDADAQLQECSDYAGGTKMTVNGTDKGASTASIYAPTTYEAKGRLLISGGTNAAPVWMGSNGSNNSILRSQGTGYNPKWGDLMSLNGSNVNTAEIYAPTTSGTSGQCLLSKGANAAPEWGAAKGSIDPTSNMYIKYQSSTTNVWNGVNSYLSISSGSKTDTLYHQYTVIGHVTYNSTNYKLVWLKLYWCASSQSWARSAKSYPGAFAKIFSIWSTNYAGYGTNVQGGRTKISAYSTSSVTTGENDSEVGTAIDVVGISSSTYYSE